MNRADFLLFTGALQTFFFLQAVYLGLTLNILKYCGASTGKCMGRVDGSEIFKRHPPVLQLFFSSACRILLEL